MLWPSDDLEHSRILKKEAKKNWLWKFPKNSIYSQPWSFQKLDRSFKWMRTRQGTRQNANRIPEFRVVSKFPWCIKKKCVFVFSTWFYFLPKSTINIFGVLTRLKNNSIRLKCLGWREDNVGWCSVPLFLKCQLYTDLVSHPSARPTPPPPPRTDKRWNVTFISFSYFEFSCSIAVSPFVSKLFVTVMFHLA